MWLNILQLMQQLGYEIDEKGMCVGFGSMGMQAILAGQFKVLQKRMHVLHSYQTSEDVINAIQEANQARQSQQILSSKQKSLLSLQPFFDGVCLYHLPEKFPDLFVSSFLQQQKKVLPLTLPQKLELDEKCSDPTKEGNVEKIRTFSGVYSRQELIDYLTILYREFKSQTRPIAFMLENADHAITIGYDPKLRSLLFVNNDDVMAFGTIEKLADEILAAFKSPDKPIILATKIYNRKSQHTSVYHAFKKCEADPLWKKIHEVTLQKAKWIDNTNTSWLYIAAEQGLSQQVQSLIENGALECSAPSHTGWTPLTCAADNGHIDVVKLLLENKVDPNEKNQFGKTALHIAAKKGHVDIVRFLLARDEQFATVFQLLQLLDQLSNHIPYSEIIEETYKQFLLNLKNEDAIRACLEHLIDHVETSLDTLKNQEPTLFPAENPLAAQLKKALEIYDANISLIPCDIIKTCTHSNNP